LYSLNEKSGIRPSGEISARKLGFLLVIFGWGESDKAILQVCIAVFSGRWRNIFRAKMAESPPKYWPVRPRGR